MSVVEVGNSKGCNILTLADCYKILRNSFDGEGNFQILDFIIKPVIDSVGFLGEYYNLNLKYVNDTSKNVQPLDLFVKTLPHKNVEISKYMKDAGIMRKEAHLYMNLLNDLQKFSNRPWCPKCYLAKEDLIVLENIKNIGYETFEVQRKFFNEIEVESVLNSLATMHASSIAYEVKTGVNILTKFNDFLFELSLVPKCQWFQVGKATVLKLAAKHPKYQAASTQNFIKNKLPAELMKIMKIIEPSEKYRNVFSHRDLWAGNIFFKNGHRTSHAIFVDFQLCRYLPPAIDVLMALYLGLHPCERKQNMKNYCFRYYESFKAALELQDIQADNHLTWQQFKVSLEDLNLFGSFYNCLCATLLRLPNNFLNEMKLERPSELDNFMYVERSKTILALMQKYPEYANYVNDCIEDLMEFLLS